jgi:hypothetical protein
LQQCAGSIIAEAPGKSPEANLFDAVLPARVVTAPRSGSRFVLQRQRAVAI